MEDKIYNVPKYYRITVILKDSQINEHGNYLITCLNPNGTIAPYIVPVKNISFAAFNFKEMKRFINSFVDEQIDSIEVVYK